MITMYDSVINNLPPEAQAIGGYMGGSWPTATTDWFKAHRAPHKLTIAINDQEHARCLDVEPRDATPNQAPAWFRNFADHSHGKPVMYAAASDVQGVINALSNAGIGRDKYLIWSAHTGMGEHICGRNTCGYPNADGTQWTFTARGENLDQSLLSDAFFGPPPPPPDPNHYLWFPMGPCEINKKLYYERKVVKEYDGLRVHPFIHRPRLHTLRLELNLLANRVYHLAYDFPNKDKSPSWDTHYRGFRYQGLSRRAHGDRLV